MPVHRAIKANKVTEPRKRARPVVNDARFDLLLPADLLDQLRAHARDARTSAASILRHLAEDFLAEPPRHRKAWPA